jgi:PST family polysaccharide transporter
LSFELKRLLLLAPHKIVKRTCTGTHRQEFRSYKAGVEPTSKMEISQGRKPGKERLLDNIVSLYLLQGLNYLIPLAVLPYLVRVLGMETYGLIAFAQSFAQYFNILTDYGFNFSATRFIAQNRQSPEAISRAFCCVYLIKFFLAGIGLILLLALLTVIPRLRHDAMFFAAGFLAVLGSVLFPIWYFQGIEKMRYISFLTGAPKILSAVLLFVLVRRPQDALLAITIQSMGVVVAGALGLWFALRDIRIQFEWPSWPELRNTFEEGWHLFVSSAAISLYTNTNVFLVGMLAGNTQAGYFSAAEKMIRAMNGLIGPITQAIFPHINSLARHSADVALAFISKSLAWLAALTIVPSLVMLFLAKPITLLFFGAGGAGSVGVVRWIALLPFLIAVSNILGTQTMVTFGLDRQFSRILIASGLLNIVIAVPLIKLFAAQGAGASVLIAETVVTVTMAFVLRKHNIHVFRFRSTEA